MNIIDRIFSKTEYQLPIVFKSDDFKTEVQRLMTNYINELTRENVDEKIVGKIRKFRASCSYTLTNYLRGIHSNAFVNFEKAIANLDIENSLLLKSTLGGDVLFRGRENKEDRDYDDDQMYHIPLDKRGIITTQRYSFPRLPCLYAGASIYTCWVEMNRPSFDKFQVATIEPNEEAQKMKVYDLSNIPQRINDLRKEIWFDEDEYLCYWPLMALCSIKSNHDNNAFKPEYIFPQFLLEHIMKGKKNEEYVGIRYISIKVASICRKQLEEDWHTYVNYVFPSRSDSMSEKRCSILNDRFIISHNRSGRELQVLAGVLGRDRVRTKFHKFGEKKSQKDILFERLYGRRVYTHDGKSYPYILSEYGLTEVAVQIERLEDIEEDNDLEIMVSTSADIDGLFPAVNNSDA